MLGNNNSENAAIVEEMMNNYEEDSADETTTQSNTETVAPEPEIDSLADMGGSTDSRTRREKKCLSYAREFVKDGYEGTHLPVELEDLTFRVSGKMTRASGRYTPSKKEIVISGRLMEKSDWDDVKNTIRHELVHAWQHQTLEWPRKTHSGSKWQWHGVEFKKWCGPLDISVRADAPAEQEYKYDIHCPNCGHIGGKQRKCKSIKEMVKGTSARYCITCGSSTSGELYVTKDGHEINSIHRL